MKIKIQQRKLRGFLFAGVGSKDVRSKSYGGHPDLPSCPNGAPWQSHHNPLLNSFKLRAILAICRLHDFTCFSPQ